MALHLSNRSLKTALGWSQNGDMNPVPTWLKNCTTKTGKTFFFITFRVEEAGIHDLHPLFPIPVHSPGLFHHQSMRFVSVCSNPRRETDYGHVKQISLEILNILCSIKSTSSLWFRYTLNFSVISDIISSTFPFYIIDSGRSKGGPCPPYMLQHMWWTNQGTECVQAFWVFKKLLLMEGIDPLPNLPNVPLKDIGGLRPHIYEDHQLPKWIFWIHHWHVKPFTSDTISRKWLFQLIS